MIITLLAARIVDGDTFDVYPHWRRGRRDGNRIRPEGYDTPEFKEPGFKKTTKELENRIEHREVHLHARLIDRYGRLMCRVWGREYGRQKELPYYFPKYRYDSYSIEDLSEIDLKGFDYDELRNKSITQDISRFEDDSLNLARIRVGTACGVNPEDVVISLDRTEIWKNTWIGYGLDLENEHWDFDPREEELCDLKTELAMAHKLISDTVCCGFDEICISVPVPTSPSKK